MSLHISSPRPKYKISLERREVTNYHYCFTVREGMTWQDTLPPVTLWTDYRAPFSHRNGHRLEPPGSGGITAQRRHTRRTLRDDKSTS